MKSLLNMTLGRQIQLAVCVFVLLPATLSYGPLSGVFDRIDLLLRGATTPSAVISATDVPAVVDIGNGGHEVYTDLLGRMDRAASVTLVDILDSNDDALVEAIRYNGATYVTDAVKPDGRGSIAAVRAAARGIGHARLPDSAAERHDGLRAWRLSGSQMRASAALMPLLADADWREHNQQIHAQPDLSIIAMRLPPVDVLEAGAVLAEPAATTDARFNGRHVYMGSTQPSDDGTGGTALKRFASFHAALAGGRVLTRPDWADTAAWLFIAVAAFALVSIMWRESRRVIASVGATSIIVLMASQWLLAHYFALQIDVARPGVAVLAGFVVCFIATPDRKSNRRESFRAGLRYLRAGRLDAAFGVFQTCAPHPSLMPTLYKLAIAFEKEGQPEQSRAVFAYMSRRDAGAAPESSETSPALRGGNAIPDSIPEMLDRYEVLRPLGKGAMGGVFLGRDPRINRLIALKIVSFRDIDDEGARVAARARFFQEAESAGRLTHPAITAVYDSGEVDGLGYIAMEYVPGEQLNRYIASDKLLDPLVVFRAMIRVAEALHYAHAEHVVHRDIKPDNLIYDASTESLKITDFGVAKLVDAERTQTGIVLGTPSYMSPEQARGDDVTGSSDLFSLGVTLYELLTGDVPFRGKTIAELMAAIDNKAPRPVSELRPDLPDGIDQFMETALAKQPENRFADGNEMAFALRECTSRYFVRAVNA